MGEGAVLVGRSFFRLTESEQQQINLFWPNIQERDAILTCVFIFLQLY